jgi:hypothetical protein
MNTAGAADYAIKTTRKPMLLETIREKSPLIDQSEGRSNEMPDTFASIPSLSQS